MKSSIVLIIIIFIAIFITNCATVRNPNKCENPSVVYLGSNARTGDICVILEYKDGSKMSFCPNDEEP